MGTVSIEEIRKRCTEFFALSQGLSCGHCSPIFLFPHTTTRDYINFINEELSVPYRRWYSSGRTEGRGVYNKILKRDLLSQDPLVPTEIARRCNGVYVIANEKNHVMYIGSSESRTDHVIVRFLDHLVPERSPEYPYVSGGGAVKREEK